MSVRAHSVAAVRAAEQVLLGQVPDGALMRRAAAGLARCCADRLRIRRGRVTGSAVVLLVGAGNNGGDALWAGARLAARGARVDAVLLGPSAHAEGLAALHSAGGRVTDLGRDQCLRDAGRDQCLRDAGRDQCLRDAARRLLARADLVVDGIVGLGGSPGLREPAAQLVAGLLPAGDGGPTVVAVDLPSGVDADDGSTPAPHVRADVTVTFGAFKPGLLLPPACRHAGDVELVDIGLTPYLPTVPLVDRLTAADLAELWPVPRPDDDKYSRGVVGVVAGSASYPGAAVLAVGGALRSGAGMVRYLGPGHPAEQVRARWPEVVVGPGRVQAWVLGSGVDPDRTDDGQLDSVFEALAQRLPTVVDAGALPLVLRPQARRSWGDHLLLTPHAGELARLLSGLQAAEVTREQVLAQPVVHVTRAAGLLGATVLLKGADTVIASADGRLRVQSEAPPWLATAGAGDVLAGLLGTLLAAGLGLLDAAGVGASVHGRAAALASTGAPILAQDVIDALPGAIADLIA